jgi:hypothetical protein
MLAHGDQPSGMLVCHTCDNPPCCNPRHLFLGTKADNSADMRRKGRSAVGPKNGTHTQPHRRARGERAGGAKYSNGLVAEIRALGATHTRSELSRRFGISIAQVSLIVRGLSRRAG